MKAGKNNITGATCEPSAAKVISPNVAVIRIFIKQRGIFSEEQFEMCDN